ncbi:Minor extracellular protease vpr protein [Ceratobasidium theobromae]|uniref:Minor extracellular protease vpr protein n=1 Tax=Ceratobasidium theobromae TaxID=1582974 RepID=A0A5N5QE99_9AGAM|nr:Minor extracellular protease vpr protein [Ceratobasidium theobromae]
MRIPTIVLAASLLASAAVDSDSKKRVPSLAVAKNVFVVELKSGTNLKRGFDSPHQELYYDLQRRGANWITRAEYRSEILTGVTIQVGSKADLLKLSQITNVRSISPVYRRPVPHPVISQVLTNATTNTDYFPPHIMTGVDKAHAENYTGAGVTVGIIDTGVDYTHVLLGGKIGPGNKIIGGHDFVGDDYTGTDGSIPVPDDDPLDQCLGHGTHIAGILGANPGGPYNISGVAYGASLNVYRIFGCLPGGQATDDVIIAAMLRAYEDGNDIITLSLGSESSWFGGALDIIATRLVSKGKIIVAAVGNDGFSGAWLASSPGTGLGVISAGSVDNIIANIQNATLSNGRLIPYEKLMPISIPPGLQLYATSSDITNPADACDPLPSNTPDLSNYLVIIRLGTCSPTTKLKHATAFGAKYFVVYDNKDESILDVRLIKGFAVAFFSQQDGIFIVQQAIPQGLTISFTNLPYNAPTPRGGLTSRFSSYGPTYDMNLEPAVTAPGSFIPSTYPVPLGMYALLSGTSMSTPYVAGAAALLLQAHGKSPETVHAIRTILQNTAVPTKETKAPDSLTDTAAHQGAGLLQVYDAIKSASMMYPSELLLNDTSHFKNSHLLFIKNLSKQSVTYTFSHLPAGTANTISGIEPNLGPVPLVPNSAAVRIVPPKLTIQAGHTLATFVTFTPPGGLSSSNFPVYTGCIVATGSDKTTLRSTYMGVAASLKDMKILDNTPVGASGATFPALFDGAGNIIPPGGSTTYTMKDADAPGVLIRLAAGTTLIRVELIDVNAELHAAESRSVNRGLGSGLEKRAGSDPLDPPFPTPPELPTFNSILPELHPSTKKVVGTNILGVLAQFNYVPRDGPDFDPNDDPQRFTQFVNGTNIPDGQYKILVRALKITGNPNQAEDYDIWLSPKFVVKRT